MITIQNKYVSAVQKFSSVQNSKQTHFLTLKTKTFLENFLKYLRVHLQFRYIYIKFKTNTKLHSREKKVL